MFRVRPAGGCFPRERRRHQLLLLAEAVGGFCLFARPVQGGEQHRSEDCDDRNDHQEFDQSKSPVHFSSLFWLMTAMTREPRVMVRVPPFVWKVKVISCVNRMKIPSSFSLYSSTKLPARSGSSRRMRALASTSSSASRKSQPSPPGVYSNSNQSFPRFS